MFLTKLQLFNCRWSEKYCFERLYDSTFSVGEIKYLYKAIYKLGFKEGEKRKRKFCLEESVSFMKKVEFDQGLKTSKVFDRER